jgi:hypothetical protein
VQRLVTPFRGHYEHSCGLSLESQLRECADYLENPQVLLTEFLESCCIVERELDPEARLKPEAGDEDELVLEPFFERLELRVREPSGKVELVTCLSGALSPLPGDEHPALGHGGLDYVGVRTGSAPGLVLGAVQGPGEETPYLLLLRALNGLAELAAPFQVLKLGRDLLGASLPPESRFDLQIALGNREAGPLWVSLGELTRDLAHVFKRGIAASPQFDEAIGRIECLTFDPDAQGTTRELALRWRV